MPSSVPQTPKHLSSLGTKEALTSPICPLGSSVGYVSFLRAVTDVVAQLSQGKWGTQTLLLFLCSYLAVRPTASHIPPWPCLQGTGLVMSEPLTARTISTPARPGPTPGLCFQPLLRCTLPRITILSPLHPMMAEPWRDFLCVQSQE